MTPEEVVAALRARYAVKRFDPAGRVSPEAWSALRRALVLTPSSYGLQPWKFLEVEDPALRARLREASWGQSQVSDADRFLVLAARRDLDEEDVSRLVERTAEVRGKAPAALEGFRKMLLAAVRRPERELAEWNARQIYIALGQFMAAAAALGVATCPMEGFDPAAYDRLLGLEGTRYRSVVAVAAGAAADEPPAKVRYPEEALFERR